MTQEDRNYRRQVALRRLEGRTIVDAKGTGEFDASITLTLDNGVVVELWASGDDSARLNIYLEDQTIKTVSVPEVTDAMIEAGLAQFFTQASCRQRIGDIYRAMVAARVLEGNDGGRRK